MMKPDRDLALAFVEVNRTEKLVAAAVLQVEAVAHGRDAKRISEAQLVAVEAFRTHLDAKVALVMASIRTLGL